MRKDLYYRLNVVEIKVPPLRERIEDIPEITESLVKTLSSAPERGVKTIEKIDERVYELLMEYDWPGNIRELSNIVERAVNRCYERTLKTEHFVDFRRRIDKESRSQMFSIGAGKTLKEIKSEAEKCAVKAALSRNGGNITRAADELGISRQMLHRKLHDSK